MRKKEGFTLIELLIAIGIVLTLSSFIGIKIKEVKEKKVEGKINFELSNFLHKNLLILEKEGKDFSFELEKNSEGISFIKIKKSGSGEIETFTLPEGYTYKISTSSGNLVENKKINFKSKEGEFEEQSGTSINSFTKASSGRKVNFYIRIEKKGIIYTDIDFIYHKGFRVFKFNYQK